LGDVPNYYDVLGVPQDASEDLIRAAHRALVRVWHPDVHPDADKRDYAEERFKKISEAYEILKDRARRDEYDRELAAGARSGSTSGSGASSSSGSGADDTPDEPEAFNIRVGPETIDFGVLKPSGPSVDAEIVLSWDGGSPSMVRCSPPNGDWWEIRDPVAEIGSVTFTVSAQAYDGISDGRHTSHVDIMVDGVAYRVGLVMTIVGTPSKPSPPPPDPGGGYVPPSSPTPTPPLPISSARTGLLLTSIAAGLAIIAILAYILWPSTPPPKYLVSDVQSHGAYIASVTISPNTAMVASAGADNAFAWSNVDGSGAGQAGGYAASCSAVAYTPDNVFLIAGCGADLLAWTVGDPSGNSPTDLGSTDGSVNAIAFSPNQSGGKDPFVVATSKGAELWTYSPNNGNFDEYHTLSPSSSVVSIAYSANDGPDGTLLAGLSKPQVYGSGSIEIWDVGTGKLMTSFADPYALGVAFSPDGNTLAISTLTGIQFYNVTTGRLAMAIKYGPYDPLGPGGALAYSPDGAILAFADGWNKIGLWNLASGKLVGSLPASGSGEGLVYSLAFSSDSTYLASGGGNSSCSGACDDPSVHIWNVSSFTQ
jgi:WD40 repeat protein